MEMKKIYGRNPSGVFIPCLVDATGKLLVSGGGVAGVSSFNTRTGAVVPAINDYTWAQINKTVSSIADITTRNHTDLVAGDGTDHANVVLNDTHRGSDGKNHSDVVLNNTHRGSDGKNHSDVVLNNTHRASDGKNHSDVVLNNTHRGSTGGDHTWLNQSLLTSASPTFNNLTLSGGITMQGSGSNIKNNVGSSFVQIWGGATQTSGASTQMYGEDHSSYPGDIYFVSGGETAEPSSIIEFAYRNGGYIPHFRIESDGGIFAYNMKSGTTQVGAGAAANELWADTDDAYSVKLGT